MGDLKEWSTSVAPSPFHKSPRVGIVKIHKTQNRHDCEPSISCLPCAFCVPALGWCSVRLFLMILPRRVDAPILQMRKPSSREGMTGRDAASRPDTGLFESLTHHTGHGQALGLRVDEPHFTAEETKAGAWKRLLRRLVCSGYRAGSPAFVLISIPSPLRTPLDELLHR